MKMRCVCDDDYVYDHNKAGQQFKCRWCGQVIVMPHFESLSPEDQSFYRMELQEQREKEERAKQKEERAAQKVEQKKQLTTAKEDARLRKMRSRVTTPQRQNWLSDLRQSDNSWSILGQIGGLLVFFFLWGLLSSQEQTTEEKVEQMRRREQRQHEYNFQQAQERERQEAYDNFREAGWDEQSAERMTNRMAQEFQQ